MQILRRGSVRMPVVLVSLLVLSAQFSVAQFWVKKPYQQWSKDDAKSMLSDSPWAKEVVLADVKSSVQITKSLNTSTGTKGSQVKYQVQLRSAQPVREAVVRLTQLTPRYQQLPANQKTIADRKGEEFINATPDTIVFWVSYASTEPGQNMDLFHYWSSQSLALLPNTIWLKIPGQQKVEPTYFGPGPDQSFEVHFPRPKDLPADGTMVFEFRHPDATPPLAGQAGATIRAEFSLKKLIVGGTALY